MQLPKADITKKIRRLLGKSHIGLVCGQHINDLLEVLNQLVSLLANEAYGVSFITVGLMVSGISCLGVRIFFVFTGTPPECVLVECALLLITLEMTAD